MIRENEITIIGANVTSNVGREILPNSRSRNPNQENANMIMNLRILTWDAQRKERVRIPVTTRNVGLMDVCEQFLKWNGLVHIKGKLKYSDKGNNRILTTVKIDKMQLLHEFSFEHLKAIAKNEVSLMGVLEEDITNKDMRTGCERYISIMQKPPKGASFGWIVDRVPVLIAKQATCAGEMRKGAIVQVDGEVYIRPKHVSPSIIVRASSIVAGNIISPEEYGLEMPLREKVLLS